MENPSARDIFEIIAKILLIIPKEEVELITALNKYLNKLEFMPPEYLFGYYAWKPLADILNKNILDIKTDWQIKIRDIMNG
jgi:hypothetical protein